MSAGRKPHTHTHNNRHRCLPKKKERKKEIRILIVELFGKRFKWSHEVCMDVSKNSGSPPEDLTLSQFPNAELVDQEQISLTPVRSNERN